MKIYVFFLTIILTLPCWSSGKEQVHLNRVDLLIYEETFEICKPGTLASAVRLGFSISNFTASTLNWLRFLSADIQVAGTVWQNKGLSSSTTRLQKSAGFWLAMTDCYGYRYGVLNYGNLMKQVVDLGHLTTDASSAVVGLVGTQIGVRLAGQAFTTFPVASRFVVASVLSVSFANVVRAYQEVKASHLTQEESNQVEAVKELVFDEPDKAISKILEMASITIRLIDSKLGDPSLSKEERNLLLERRKTIQENIDNVKRIRGSSTH